MIEAAHPAIANRKGELQRLWFRVSEPGYKSKAITHNKGVDVYLE